jgi:hypothetical protein
MAYEAPPDEYTRQWGIMVEADVSDKIRGSLYKTCSGMNSA